MHLDTVYQSIPAAGSGSGPPVDSWNPPLSGDINIQIDNRGRWFHEGELIKRQALVNTFASILKREADEYFLVTPVEKWRICVAVAPLLVVAMEVLFPGEDHQTIILHTQQGERITVGPEYPITITQLSDEPIPVVLVRSNLSAIIARNVFYELADYAQPKPYDNGQSQPEIFGVRSQEAFFPLS